MKIKRIKKVQKNLRFYRLNFGIDKPFKVIIDGTFCCAALANQINIREQMTKYLDDSEARLVTSKCVLREMEQLGSKLGGPLHIVKQFETIVCRHKGGANSTASSCLLEAAKDQNAKFFIATQDRSLTAQLKELGNVPIIYLYNRTIVLDKPSVICLSKANNQLEAKINFEGVQKSSLDHLKKAAGIVEAGTGVSKKRKRKGPKQPNPLSRKKPKRKLTDSADAVPKKKRKRTKKVKVSVAADN